MRLAWLKDGCGGTFKLQTGCPKFVSAGSRKVQMFLRAYLDSACFETPPCQVTTLRNHYAVFFQTQIFFCQVFSTCTSGEELIIAKIGSLNDGRYHDHPTNEEQRTIYHIYTHQMFSSQLLWVLMPQQLPFGFCLFRCIQVVQAISHDWSKYAVWTVLGVLTHMFVCFVMEKKHGVLSSLFRAIHFFVKISYFREYHNCVMRH
jgi:hypothetical protein